MSSTCSQPFWRNFLSLFVIRVSSLEAIVEQPVLLTVRIFARRADFGTRLPAVDETNRVSSTTIEALVDTAIDTALGPRQVTYRNPPQSGGVDATLEDGLQVRAPTPTITSISPETVTQGETDVTVTLTGTNFRSGATVSFGAGITLTGTSYVSETTVLATVDAHLTNATLGAHDVVYAQLAEGGGAVGALVGGLQVDAPAPTLSSISPSSLAQGDTGTVITLTGTNFQSGGTVALGAGVTVTANTYVSPTSFKATVNVGLTSATLGSHDVVYTQSSAGGGATGTLSNGLTVNAPTPTITSISPTSVKLGSTGAVVTLTGTNFRSGGTVSFGSGVTVTANTFASTTSFQATITVNSAATPGSRTVTYTQPTAGGSATGMRADALLLYAPPPTLTSVTPSPGTRGTPGCSPRSRARTTTPEPASPSRGRG